MANADSVVIIKKVKKGGHAAHHGGAWKVAYADFVTAMMAFFLLLWLLNATTDEQKKGIADYFSPASMSRQTSGSGGVMGGTVMAPEGALTDQSAPIGMSNALPSADSEFDENAPEDGSPDGDLDEDSFEDILAKREEEQFAAAEAALRQAIEAVPDLQQLAQNLLVDRTPEGMRIQIVDQAGKSMFPLGRSSMFDHTEKLMKLVADAIASLPQKIAIKGHTDAAPFVANNGYSNWELSTDRANASRRALVKSGLPADRIASVAGRADRDPLLPEKPFDEQNRRITIILLRDAPAPKGG